MVKKGEYIEYMVSMPDEFIGDTVFSACRDLAVEVKKLIKENTTLKERLTILEGKMV